MLKPPLPALSGRWPWCFALRCSFHKADFYLQRAINCYVRLPHRHDLLLQIGPQKIRSPLVKSLDFTLELYLE